MPKPVDLKDGELVFKVALKKSWAKKPSYWVEIWSVPQKLNQQKTITQWVMVKSWKFTKKDQNTGKSEDIEGKIPDGGSSSFNLSFDRVDSFVQIQIEKDYTIDHVEDHISKGMIGNDFLPVWTNVTKVIQRWSETLKKPIPVINSQANDIVTIQGKDVVAPDPKTLREKVGFKAAQAKRVKKARW